MLIYIFGILPWRKMYFCGLRRQSLVALNFEVKSLDNCHFGVSIKYFSEVILVSTDLPWQTHTHTILHQPRHAPCRERTIPRRIWGSGLVAGHGCLSPALDTPAFHWRSQYLGSNLAQGKICSNEELSTRPTPPSHYFFVLVILGLLLGFSDGTGNAGMWGQEKCVYRCCRWWQDDTVKGLMRVKAMIS